MAKGTATLKVAFREDLIGDPQAGVIAGGVVTAACKCNNDNCLDHGVTAEGYGSDGKNDYYYIKNSWSADWGMNGYILLGRGAAYGPGGQCGVLIDNAYVTV